MVIIKARIKDWKNKHEINIENYLMRKKIEKEDM